MKIMHIIIKKIKNYLPNSSSGISLMEVLIGIGILGIASVVYMKTTYPVIKSNAGTKEYIEGTETTSKILDSIMMLSLNDIDSSNGDTIGMWNGDTIVVSTFNPTQTEMNAILVGTDAARIRRIRVTNIDNDSASLETYITRQAANRFHSCFLFAPSE